MDVIPAKRTRLPVDQRRAQLIEVASGYFTSRRWDDIFVEDIAAAAGVSKATFFHYFATKRDLYLALVEAGGEELMAATDPVLALPADQRLRASLLAYLAYIEDHAAGYSTFLRAGVGCDDTVWRIVERQRAVVVRRVADGLGVSELRPTLHLALRAWVGYIEALSLAWLEDRSISKDAVADLMERNLRASIEAALSSDPDSFRPEA